MSTFIHIQKYEKPFSFFEYRTSNAWDFFKFEFYKIFFPLWNVLTVFLSTQLHFYRKYRNLVH